MRTVERDRENRENRENRGQTEHTLSGQCAAAEARKRSDQYSPCFSGGMEARKKESERTRKSTLARAPRARATKPQRVVNQLPEQGQSLRIVGWLIILEKRLCSMMA